MNSHTVENYLKAIYKISEKENKTASTSAISKEMSTSAASVTDMLKRLAEKEMINYEKYKGVTLTKSGNKIATNLIRKHRLWEVFLVEKLNFRWNQVHDIAEELEHINSDQLIERLDEFLDHPKFDPHGDPIPNKDGKITLRRQTPLSLMSIKQAGHLVGVQEHSTPFLDYLDSLGIGLGTHIYIKEKFQFDQSIKILINDSTEVTVTAKVAQNLNIKTQE